MTEKLAEDSHMKKILDMVADVFFYAGIFCEMLAGFSGYVECGNIMKYIIFLGMGCFCAKILLNINVKKDWWLVLVFVVYGAICYYFQRSALVFRIELILLAGRNMDSRKVFKLFFAGTLIITIVIMIMAVLGMRGDLYEIARFRGYDEEKRYCFGFLHPNSFSIIAFKILIMFFYAFYEKLHWWVIISTSTIVIPFVFLSGSITAIFVSLFVIVAVILFKIFKGNGFRRLTYILGNIGILATIGFSYAVMFLFDGKLEEIDGDYVAVGFWETINQRFFHGRLSIAYDAYKLYGLKPFGMKSDTVTAEIGYINTTLNQGYVFMCIYVLIVFILFYKLYKAKNSMGMIVVLAIVFYSFMESFIPYPNKNLIWLVGIGYLFTTVHGDAEKNEQYLQKK